MWGVALRSILGSVPVLLIVSLITFGMMRLIPGDPSAAIGGLSATAEQLATIRRDLGLDEPLIVQLLKWYSGLLQGNLGRSILMGQDVFEVTMIRLPVTIALALYALVLTLLLGMVSGIIAALRQNTVIDQLAMVFAMIGISVPNFFLATLLVLLFSFKLRWLPNVGYKPFADDPVGNLKLMILPAISLGLPFMAIIMRFTRSAVLEVMGQEYVRVARAKGLPQARVIVRHVLPNAGIPVLTVAGIQVAALLGGTVIVEQIFALPGVGRYIYEAIANRDYPVVQSVTLVMATIFVTVSLVVDVLYAVFDPRLRNR